MLCASIVYHVGHTTTCLVHSFFIAIVLLLMYLLLRWCIYFENSNTVRAHAFILIATIDILLLLLSDFLIDWHTHSIAGRLHRTRLAIIHYTEYSIAKSQGEKQLLVMRTLSLYHTPYRPWHRTYYIGTSMPLAIAMSHPPIRILLKKK